MCINKHYSQSNNHSNKFLLKPNGPLNPFTVNNKNYYEYTSKGTALDKNTNAWPAASVVGSSCLSPGSNPYGFQNNDPNLLLLTPAIFGGFGAFIVGFGYYGHSLTGGYSKFILFVNIYAIIATFGTGYYIYELVQKRTGDARFSDIILPILVIILFYAAIYNLIYSLYPSTFKGTIGDTKITQFLSFLARSVGTISIGESFSISVETSGVQVLTSAEALFNFFVITLLISLLA